MELIIAIVTSLLSLVGVCVTAWAGNRRTGAELSARLETAQAVTDTRLDELTREVREHNNFARRMPVVEEQLKVLSHRIKNLERGGLV